MFLVIDSLYGDPFGSHATREEAFAAIDGMVGDAIAEPGEFSVIEYRDGRPVGRPFPAPSELAYQAAEAAR